MTPCASPPVAAFGLRVASPYTRDMFGPLNGVRSALVIAAAIAALAAAIVGEWVMAALLFLGVALHGVGWWYLWRQRVPTDNP